MKNRLVIIVSFLLFSHLLLSLSAAFRLSPTWDEINYPVSGAIVLKTGSLSFYPRNPWLARLIYGMAAWAAAPEGMNTFAKLESQDSAMAGFHFAFQQAKNPIKTIVLTRLPAIFLSLVCALLIFASAFLLWGESGAIISLICYLSIPIFLSRASLALLEMPMFAFMMAALLAHQIWLEKGGVRWIFWGCFFSALSILCKLTALPLLGVIFISTVLAKEKRHRFKVAAAYAAGTLVLFIVGYCVWREGYASLIASLKALIEFNRQIPFYWRGQYREAAPSLISWIALWVKAPLVILVLFIGSLGSLRGRLSSPRIRLWWLLTAVFFGLPLLFDLPVSTIQLSPLYLGVTILTGAWGLIWDKKVRGVRTIIAILLALSLADALQAYPNYLGYFNLVSGGMNRGAYWLADSDQDWGQSLPSLASELKRHPAGLTILAYSGAADPEAYDIPYLDLVSAALVSREHKNRPLSDRERTGPIYLAIGSKMKQIAPDFFDWLEQNRRPLKIIDGTFDLYEVSNDKEALSWLASRFDLVRQPADAMWFQTTADQAVSVKR